MMAEITSRSDSEIPFRKRSVSGIRLYITVRSLNVMIDHAHSDMENEIMGLLVGKIYRDDEGTYATVERTVTSGLISDKLSVRFHRDSMESLFESLEGAGDEKITGWYHSHLGIGCFMSETDVRTHSGIFGDDCGFALVIDPLRQEIKAFGNPDSKEVMFVVMED